MKKSFSGEDGEEGRFVWWGGTHAGTLQGKFSGAVIKMLKARETQCMLHHTLRIIILIRYCVIFSANL